MKVFTQLKGHLTHSGLVLLHVWNIEYEYKSLILPCIQTIKQNHSGTGLQRFRPNEPAADNVTPHEVTEQVTVVTRAAAVEPPLEPPDVLLTTRSSSKDQDGEEKGMRVTLNTANWVVGARRAAGPSASTLTNCVIYM